ncbi:terpenoid synthase, partial [Clavulina sp. PMI_390]
WTIPLAIVLSALYYPLRTSVDTYRIGFLLIVAVVYTIPWDSYLIRSHVWTYPPDAILGPKFLDIPAEELFFFIIQTHITSVIYLILSKTVLHVTLLSESHNKRRQSSARIRAIGLTICYSGIALGIWLVWTSIGGDDQGGLYLGLILVWSFPVLTFLWHVASSHIIALPLYTTGLPIIIPTLFLWVVDTLALHRGTWVIESGTKHEWHLWMNLDFEEALFFVLTNIQVTFGQIAFDKCYNLVLAHNITNPSDVRSLSLSKPVTWLYLIKQAISPEMTRNIHGAIDRLIKAQGVLKGKSRSFSIASSVFEGTLRVDLINLYAFCRVMDDIFHSLSTSERLDQVRSWIESTFSTPQRSRDSSSLTSTNPDWLSMLSPAAQSAFAGLPHYPELKRPLLELLNGFEMDCAFSTAGKSVAGPDTQPKHPSLSFEAGVIKVDDDLLLYSYRVAGTIAEMCVALAYRHSTLPACQASLRSKEEPPKDVVDAAVEMGIALQLINIARDIEVDLQIEAKDGGPRVYIPHTWREQYNRKTIRPQDAISMHRKRLLQMAFRRYEQARSAMGQLPTEGGARRGMHVAVESYVQIGRELCAKMRLTSGLEGKQDGKVRRASVPLWKRVWVVWWTSLRAEPF